MPPRTSTSTSSKPQTATVPDQHQQPSARVSHPVPRQPDSLKTRLARRTAFTIQHQQNLVPAAQPVQLAEPRSTTTQIPGVRRAARREPELSVERSPATAAAASPPTQLLLLPGTCDGHAAWLLVDSGAQQDSLSTQFAHKHGIWLQQGSATTVKMANGDYQCASHIARVRVELGGQQEECTLMVMPMPDYDAIPGKAWLDRHATQIEGSAIPSAGSQPEDKPGAQRCMREWDRMWPSSLP